MSYLVTFRDKTTVTIENERGEKLKKIKLEPGDVKNVELNDDLYLLSEIVSIKKANSLEADWSEHARTIVNKQISQTGCKGKKSIQWAIHKLIVKKYPSEWPKLVRDKTLREKIRLQIIKADPSYTWCDYKQMTCGCKAT